MKQFIFTLMIGLAFVACKGPGGDKAEVTDAQETATASDEAKDLAVDTEKSVVTWVGSKPAGKHNGIIKISSGTLSVEDNMVTAGNFTLDMNTVESTDESMDAEKNGQLTGHLKSDDFFDVANYPEATFEIVSVDDIANHASEDALKLEGATHFVTGNLTMKDATKAVKFPAVIGVSDGGVRAKALFHIDRTDWGMHYKSDKSFGDQIIHAKVQVGFELVAN